MPTAHTPKPESTHTTEDVLCDGPCTGFRLLWDVENHWADVTVYAIAGRATMDPASPPEFVMADWHSLPADMTTDVASAEVYLSGFIKWDGCTELDMGQPHWCGPEGYAAHCALLKHIYHRAFELMGRTPLDEPWPAPDATALVAALHEIAAAHPCEVMQQDSTMRVDRFQAYTAGSTVNIARAALAKIAPPTT